MIDFLLTTTTSCYNVLDNKECCILCCVFKFVGYNEPKILLRYIGRTDQIFLYSFCEKEAMVFHTKGLLGRDACEYA